MPLASQAKVEGNPRHLSWIPSISMLRHEEHVALDILHCECCLPSCFTTPKFVKGWQESMTPGYGLLVPGQSARTSTFPPKISLETRSVLRYHDVRGLPFERACKTS